MWHTALCHFTQSSHFSYLTLELLKREVYLLLLKAAFPGTVPGDTVADVGTAQASWHRKMLQRSTYEPKTYFFFFPPKIYFKEIGKLANRVSTVWKKPVTLKQGWSLLELLEARSQLCSRSESKQPAPRNCGTALSAPARWCQLLTSAHNHPRWFSVLQGRLHSPRVSTAPQGVSQACPTAAGKFSSFQPYKAWGLQHKSNFFHF